MSDYMCELFFLSNEYARVFRVGRATPLGDSIDLWNALHYPQRYSFEYKDEELSREATNETRSGFKIP